MTDFAADVLAGLTAARKTLPPHWFYDGLGSALFGAICELPEYYPTRAETEILQTHGPAIGEALGFARRIIELGSGSARKTRILLDRLDVRGVEYVPVDVDEGMLEKCSRELTAEYPGLRVTPVRSDFRDPAAALADVVAEKQPAAVLFLGSSIGNLDPNDAAAMLRSLRSVLAPGDALFLGTDLRKSASILEPAYDDALGVTAAFNLNLLQRINRELGGHSDLRAFGHRALYDPQLGRIEMHLVSLRDQTVRIDALDLDVAFAETETIHTENSYKYDEESLRALASSGAFEVTRTWTDSRGWFADSLLVAR